MKVKKIGSLMDVIGKCLEEGRYRFTRHALEQLVLRKILRTEVKSVLAHGHHEKQKDLIDDVHGVWSYSINGKTVEGRRLRVIVSFDEVSMMLIVTAIDLDQKD